MHRLSSVYHSQYNYPTTYNTGTALNCKVSEPISELLIDSIDGYKFLEVTTEIETLVIDFPFVVLNLRSESAGNNRKISINVKCDMEFLGISNAGLHCEIEISGPGKIDILALEEPCPVDVCCDVNLASIQGDSGGLWHKHDPYEQVRFHGLAPLVTYDLLFPPYNGEHPIIGENLKIFTVSADFYVLYNREANINWFCGHSSPLQLQQHARISSMVRDKTVALQTFGSNKMPHTLIGIFA